MTTETRQRLDGTGAAVRSPYAGTAALVDNAIVAARMKSRRDADYRSGTNSWETQLSAAYAEAIAQDDADRLRDHLLELIGVAADWIAEINARGDR